MTFWHLFAAYSFAGVAVFALPFVGGVVASFGKPATADGRLDVQFAVGRVRRWFFISALLIAPVVIAYAGDATRDYQVALERSNLMLALYTAIAIGWIFKLQIQIDALTKRDE